MENIWRVAFLTVFLLGCGLQGILIYIVWKPLRVATSAGERFDKATRILTECAEQINVSKKYDKLAEMQLEQAKHVVDRVPAQIEQGVQKAIVAVAAPGSGINGGITGLSGEIRATS